MGLDRGNRGFGPKELRWMGLGLEFCAVVALFTCGGYWLDKITGDTKFDFTITAFFTGLAIMIYYILKVTKDLRK